MRNNAAAIAPFPAELILFAPVRKVSRPTSGQSTSRVHTGTKLAVTHSAARCVPISVWQTHSWTKRIVKIEIHQRGGLRS